MYKNLAILGSTGSIGLQTLDVVRKLNLNVDALSAYSSIDILEEQTREFLPKLVVVYDETKAKEFKDKIKDLDIRVLSGMEGLIELTSLSSTDLVVNSLVGMVGLKPTLSAISFKKDIAFANKETLVAGGDLVMSAVKENKVKLLPVDSEHSAIFQCLEASPEKKALKKIILTASGGPFFDKTDEELKNVTLKDALNHPNWSMGNKITIDSATMMNKGLEIIEAVHLFDMPADSIDVVIHRESIIHSMIEFSDNSILAQLGCPDMRIPIQYAITYPERYESLVDEVDFYKLGKMTFYAPDFEKFKCLSACKKAIEIGGLLPCYANAANEVANKLFRDSEISFLDIGEIVSDTVNHFEYKKASDLKDVLDADMSAREYVKTII